MKSSSKSSRFYEQLAPVYHLKVDWNRRSTKENDLFAYLIGTLKPTAVLDIGCGDGGHAPRYAAASVKYQGIDNSREMIAAAIQAQSSLPEVAFVAGDMTKLPKGTEGKFDQVVMLGNTLPHLLTTRELNATLAGVSRSLTTNGHFAVQTVNPDILAKKKIYFLPPKSTSAVFFAPFYLRQGDNWVFYMPIYHLKDDTVVSTDITSVHLKFWTKRELADHARKWGLKLIAAFGNSKLDPYKAQTSDNLILIFRKLPDA